MSSSLADIMANKWDEPAEIKVIKDYVRANFKESVGVSISPRQINISVANSSLAGALRMHIHELQETLKTDKKLVIRIGR
jgi:hypothetical protein